MTEDFFTIGSEEPLSTPRTDIIRRFWMKKGDGAKVIFLSNDHITFYEHQGLPNNNSSWGLNLTCLAPLKKPCPICDWVAANPDFYKYKVRKCRCYTIIDTREWKDKANNVHKDEKKLLVVNNTAADELLNIVKMQLIARGNTLRGAVVDIFRTTKNNSCNIGDSFHSNDWRQLPDTPEFAELDYREILKPDEEKLANVARILEATKTKPVAQPEQAIKF